MSILVGAYGDTTTGGNGFTATGGLVTYDAANGIRVLDSATEYAGTITSGQTQLDNVRLAGVSGTPLSVALTGATTTINSLSISVTGAGTNSGVTLTGDAGTTLKISSGVIHAGQSVTTPVVSDTMLINVPTLDLNGKEGVVLVANTGQSGANGSHNAPLLIESVITNDGGNGLTKAGPGSLRIGGASQSTYTGDTVVNAGILYLAKSASNIAVPNDSTLVVNGGTLLQTNNQIPDSVSVTVNGGSWAISSSTSNGNVSSETIQNFTLTGGSARNGQSRGGTFNILGSATFAGGTFNGVGDGSNITVTGPTAISNGATVTLGASTSTGTAFNSKMALNGGLTITNVASGAYTPISLSAAGTAGNNGGQLILANNFTFTGNATNANTTTINAPTGTGNSGVIALNGQRTFDIGNGAAAVDLTVVPALTNHGATVGGLTKSGAGTLALLGANTYTGATSLDAGTLLVNGSLTGTSLIDVAAGATLVTGSATTVSTGAGGNLSLAGTLSSGGAGAAGALMVSLGFGGKLNFLAGSTLAFDLGATPSASDLVSFTTADDWLDGSALASLSLGGSIDYGATYTIFENVNTTGFTFAAITGYDTVNYSANFAQSGTDYELSFVAIPEPGSFLLLLGGATLLGSVRRFRGRHAAGTV
jgi:autotransporter-associated beta strand protein